MDNIGNVPSNWKPAPPQPNSAQPNDPQAAGKPEKPQKPKADKKVMLLTGVLVVLGFVVAKYVFDFVTGQVAGTAKPTEGKKSGLTTLIKVVPSGSPNPAAGQSTQQPLAVLKKKIDHTITPFELNGIFVSEGATCALINNKIVQVGDTIDGALVEDIQQDFVKLNDNGRVIKLLTRTTKK